MKNLFETSQRQTPLKSMKGHLLTFVFAGLALAGCEPTHSEVNDMIRNMALEERHRLQLTYDLRLLEVYDKGFSLEDAHAYARQFIPNKRENAAGYYFMERHAIYRLNQAQSEKKFFPAILRADVQQKQSELIVQKETWKNPNPFSRQYGEN